MSSAENGNLDNLLTWIVNPLCGVIRSLQAEAIPLGLPLVPIYRATLSRPLIDGLDASRLASYSTQFASGVGATNDAALWSVVGEAIERYSASTCDINSFRECSYLEVQNDAIDPRNWIGVDENPGRARYKYRNFDPHAPFLWTRAVSMSSRLEVYVPASFVWLSVSALMPEQRLIPTASTGLAAGQSLAAAILSGLLEIIERDAFISHWILGVVPPQLLITPEVRTSLSSTAQNILLSSALCVKLFALDNEFNVSCIVCQIGLAGTENSSLGACAHLDLPTAIEKAILEAYHVFLGALRHSRRSNSSSIAAAKIRNFMDHGMYFYHNPGIYKFFFGGMSHRNYKINNVDCISNLHDKNQLLDNLVDRLLKSGYDVFYRDITPEDFGDLGFSVVRCLVPGLQPLTAGENTLTHDIRRLQRFSSSLGWKWPTQLNPIPHPFA